MVSTLYRLDLGSLEWTLLWPKNESTSTEKGPCERYFHTAQAWNDKLVIFGGESYAPVDSSSTATTGAVAEGGDAGDETAGGPVLVTLGDISVWDTVKQEWSFPDTTTAHGVTRPEPRYAHLAVTCRTFAHSPDQRDTNMMMIIGGQNVKNAYLESVGVLDLDKMEWVASPTWDKHIGSYRAVAATSDWTVVPSDVEWPSGKIPEPASASSNGHGSPGKSSSASLSKLAERGDARVQHLSQSRRPSQSSACPVLLFSNFNFTSVRRDIDVFPAPVGKDDSYPRTSLYAAMDSTSLPPGLRFPDGCVVGRHLVVYGTHLAPSANVFCLWAVDLGPDGAAGVAARANRGEKLAWKRIDPGSVLARGSWNKAVQWHNSILILGDRERDLAADYDHRQTNFAHVAFVDLEAFGVYQPPTQFLTNEAELFGLSMLDQPFLTDFEVVCSDGKRLACSRKILEERWKWFSDKLDDFHERAKTLAEARKRSEDLGTPELGGLVDSLASARLSDASPDPSVNSPSLSASASASAESRISPRTLNLPERSEIAQAFLQYLYTRALVTPLQLSIPVLTSLLLFAKTYHELHLVSLVTHALHEALEASPVSAGTIYEAATLSNCTGLQIRALRSMMLRGASNRTSTDTKSSAGTGSLGTPASTSASMVRRDTALSQQSSAGHGADYASRSLNPSFAPPSSASAHPSSVPFRAFQGRG